MITTFNEALNMFMFLFWVVTPYVFVGRRQRFGETSVSIFSPEDGDIIFSEALISTYESTRRHNPEKQHRHLHRPANLKAHELKI
jgi:hypothetical protein